MAKDKWCPENRQKLVPTQSLPIRAVDRTGWTGTDRNAMDLNGTGTVFFLHLLTFSLDFSPFCPQIFTILCPKMAKDQDLYDFHGSEQPWL